MSDVHAEHAPGALMYPTRTRGTSAPWGTLGAHVVAAKRRKGGRARGACVGEGV